MADDDLRPMSQDEIDALFAGVTGDTGSEEKPAAEDAAPTPAAEEPAPPAEVESAEEAEEVAAEVAAEAQEPVEEPVAETEPAEEPAAATEPTPPAPATVGMTSETDALSAAAADGGGAKVSQSDIDALLAELGASPTEEAAEPEPEPEPEPAAAAPDPVDADSAAALAETMVADAPATQEFMGADSVGPKTETLTAESLAELVSKHADDEDGSGTGVINQDDIDALVQQMSEASGTPVPDHDDIAAALENHGNDIDALLNNAGAGVTMDDAVSPSLIRDAVAPQAAVATLPPGMVMSPEELRGTRYLLVAAVFLLMMCAVTLGFVVASVNGLTAELARSNQSQITASDDFAEDMAVAERWLSDRDPTNVTKGVIFLEEELKQRYPKKQETIAERLAKHFRSTGAHQRAVDEFSYIADRTSGLVMDPQFYIDYADSLHHIDHLDQAREVVYELISNEAWFLREELPDGSPVGEARLATNRRVLQQAMILLGRLYSPVSIEAEVASVRGNAEAAP